MHPAEYRRRRGTVTSVLLVLGIVLGVLSMHSVSVVASPHEMASTEGPSHVVMGHSVESVVVEPASCPSGHQVMHPCMGTVSSWPVMPVPTSVVAHMPAADAASEQPLAVVSRAGRAPPWAASSLDESVLLRV